jgi:hypothetical protein
MVDDTGDPRGRQPIAQPDEQPTALWLPVAQAAPRLGISQQALRKRIRRSTVETRQEVDGNRSRLLVRVDPRGESTVIEQSEQPGEDAVVLLQRQVEHLEGEVADLRRRLDGAEDERRRLLSLLERRRWPGVKVWWRRFWEGEG